MAGEALSYDDVHDIVKMLHGPARGHDCVDCHGPAFDWSFSYDTPGEKTFVSDEGLLYSDDVSTYRPRCRSCHRRYDIANDDRVSAAVLGNAAAARAAYADKLANDPEFAAARSAHGREMQKKGVAAFKALIETSPEFVEEQKARGRKAAASGHETMARLRESDPEWRNAHLERFRVAAEKGRAAARAAAKVRHACATCLKVSNTAGLTLHQKATGHEGRVDASVVGPLLEEGLF